MKNCVAENCWLKHILFLASLLSLFLFVCVCMAHIFKNLKFKSVRNASVSFPVTIYYYLPTNDFNGIIWKVIRDCMENIDEKKCMSKDIFFPFFTHCLRIDDTEMKWFFLLFFCIVFAFTNLSIDIFLFIKISSQISHQKYFTVNISNDYLWRLT